MSDGGWQNKPLSALVRVVVAVVALLAVVTGGCGLLGEEGSGVLVTRRIQVPVEIERVEIGDAFRSTIRVGAAAPSGEIAIDDNLLDRLRVEVDGDTLRIDLDGRVRDATLRADIGLVRLRSLDISGASQVRVEGQVTDDLTIDASGASRIEVGSVELDELFLDVSGASQVSIDGTAGHLRADVSGASRLAMFGLEADEAEVDVSGASDAELTVLGRLEARASGASSVRYRGEPDRVISDESGASSVEPA
jgi:Putative auto-transporter adhesin, head GIN domain